MEPLAPGTDLGLRFSRRGCPKAKSAVVEIGAKADLGGKTAPNQRQSTGPPGPNAVAAVGLFGASLCFVLLVFARGSGT